MRTSKLTKRKRLGNLGENIVAKALERRGYKVLGRQVHTRFGEIDLIVRKQRLVLFVEVKTRTSLAFGFPEEAINFHKRRHLTRSASCLVNKFVGNYEWMILIATLEMDLKNKKAHLRAMFMD